MKTIAKKYLKKYRLYRRLGHSVFHSRTMALFSITCGKRGAANLLGQAHARKHYQFWSR